MIKPKNTEVLVDGAAFWKRLESDIAAAKQSVHVQTLSFEGDEAGHALADALSKASCADKRILIDCFNRYFQSDRFIYAPTNARRQDVRDEVRATREMIAGLQLSGVQIQYTNPAGLLLQRLPARDHKKIVVIDNQVAYVGGINFCEHNFAWHDMMLRIDRSDVAAALDRDFLATWQGAAVPAVTECTDTEVLNLTGIGNEIPVQRVLDRIAQARSRIYVISPYMTFPFTDALQAAVARGVRVTVVTPANNNRGFLHTYMLAEASGSGFDLREYQGKMSHLKAMLIDDECLIAGSSNFDWMTYHLLGEVILITRDRDTIAQFKERVLVPDLAQSAPARTVDSAWQGVAIEALMKVAAFTARRLCRRAITRAPLATALALALSACDVPDREIIVPQHNTAEISAADGPTVMTRNLYLGADFAPVLAAASLQDVPFLAARAWSEIHATNFPARAGLIAEEIAASEPHLVGLQEAVIYHVQSPSGAIVGGAVPATTVRLDGVLPFDDVRFTMRDAILVRGDVVVMDEGAGNYLTRVSLPVGGPSGPPIQLQRGWTAVDVRVNGGSYRFVNTHLEIEEMAPLQHGQEQELIAMLARSPLPLIVVGDLNSRADGSSTQSYRLMLNAGFVDAWSKFGSDGHTCCQAANLLNEKSTFDRRIDYVFTRGFNATPVSQPQLVGDKFRGMWPSDHAGIVVTLRTPAR